MRAPLACTCTVLCLSLRMQADVGIYVCVGIAGCHLSSWWFLGVLGRYAIAKRAQVTLNEMWAVREPRVGFYAMHPGACVHTLVQGVYVPWYRGGVRVCAEVLGHVLNIQPCKELLLSHGDRRGCSLRASPVT